MRPSQTTLAFILCSATALTGCAGGGGDRAESTSRGPQNAGASPTTPAASADRAIAEADIIQKDGALLYALSRSGTLSVVDVGTPGALSLVGQTTLVGQPFEMYLRDGVLVTLVGPAVETDAYGSSIAAPDATSAVQLVDVSDATQPVPRARITVSGAIADSRVMGDVLYLASHETIGCYGCNNGARTVVTSFDLGTRGRLRKIDEAVITASDPYGYDQAHMVATDDRLYLGGQSDLHGDNATGQEGIIDVLDISDHAGTLKKGPRLYVTGVITNRWQLDERDGILTVISQRGAGRTQNGIGAPEIETFLVGQNDFARLGRVAMSLPRQESLRAVRFDQGRAYAITYEQTDPLFVIDLSNPAQPKQRGELLMPGFMFHLEPHGDRVIGLGVDRTDPNGSMNVSLFDVADADAPTLLSRVSFGQPYVGEAATIAGALAEDQDRIQKAFRVLEGGLVVVPFNAVPNYGYYETGRCTNAGGGVQLVRWTQDELKKGALLPIPGIPRRALENGDELLAVSDTNVRAFDARSAAQTADLVIGTCAPGQDYGYDWVEGRADGEAMRWRLFGCSAAPGQASGSAAVIALAIALVALRRRRAA